MLVEIFRLIKKCWEVLHQCRVRVAQFVLTMQFVGRDADINPPDANLPGQNLPDRTPSNASVCLLSCSVNVCVRPLCSTSHCSGGLLSRRLSAGGYYPKKVKVKEVDLYSAFIEVPHTQGAQVQITLCYLQITPYLPLPRKHSPDGASPD